jgi:hypothetical protein
MITEVKVGLRKRGLMAVREGFPAHGRCLLRQRLGNCAPAVTVATTAAMINCVTPLRMVASIHECDWRQHYGPAGSADVMLTTESAKYFGLVKPN